MSLTDKLRELAELDREMKSDGLSFGAIGHVLTSVDIPALLAEAERLEAQNARLRDLVREAYEEGFDDGESDAISLSYRSTGVDQSWETSAAKAALDKEAA